MCDIAEIACFTANICQEKTKEEKVDDRGCRGKNVRAKVVILITIGKNAIGKRGIDSVYSVKFSVTYKHQNAEAIVTEAII